MLPQEVFESIIFDLSILNENDNSPTFESAVVSISVPESQPIRSRIEISELVAFDADGKDSRDLTYQISSNGLFDIESDEGRVFLSPKVALNREETAFMSGNAKVVISTIVCHSLKGAIKTKWSN